MNQSQILIAEMRDTDGIQIRVKTRAEHGLGQTRACAKPSYPHHVWSYDFVFDQTIDGRRLKCLTVLDEFSRAALSFDHEYEQKIEVFVISNCSEGIPTGRLSIANSATDESQAAAGKYRDCDIAASVEHFSDRVEREKRLNGSKSFVVGSCRFAGASRDGQFSIDVL